MKERKLKGNVEAAAGDDFGNHHYNGSYTWYDTSTYEIDSDGWNTYRLNTGTNYGVKKDFQFEVILVVKNQKPCGVTCTICKQKAKDKDVVLWWHIEEVGDAVLHKDCLRFLLDTMPGSRLEDATERSHEWEEILKSDD
jgi:hypothetical protein